MIALRRTLAALLLCASGATHAASLQISPVTIEFGPDDTATGITLRNPGDRPVYGQVRVFRWDQTDGHDTLIPTQDLIASPPMIQVGTQGDQLIRVVRTARAAPGTEQSYRLLIDELPQPGEAPTNGVSIRLRYSIPVFVEPAGDGAPRLDWTLLRDNGGWVLRVRNAGGRRAQLASVRLVTADGRAYSLTQGLLGYALAGRTGQWSVPLPAGVSLGGSVTVRAAVNSQPVSAVVAVEPPG
ncbi:molecular chaperone [Burkholderia multivorans]|uniref:fimbrial biogenesis chaperone n=3 Tax=Burkholderia multivorans TaxID=87883 RepID=UPI000DAB7F2A|nr:molecular chaperone [Burkholderia multivorans]MBR8044530.1 molecular chaperone [Burkholderia multivorans]MBU9203040.1 molecular chaperone [Burkholderia multivorans]MBU9662283.1 molecular chaperone [Burkholderia multivorans]MDN7845493.1 molecular chaperone [Burkholderia multivorans]RAA28980.1 molecular chaperone [Burkholderia multivorans]